MSFAPALLLALAATPSPEPADAREHPFADALAVYRAGDYGKAAAMLSSHPNALPHGQDYRLYFLGEAWFHAGVYAKAQATFAELSQLRDSRFAPIAAWRVADCLWMEDQHQQASASYRKLLAGKPPTGAGGAKILAGDPAVARFRVAEARAEEAAAAKNTKVAQEAGRAFMQVHVDFPAHPLGIEAGRRAAALLPRDSTEAAPTALTAQERLRRADTLAKGHHYQEAIDELALLPATLPPDVAAQRDVALGMAKYHARRDYAGAAELLLAVAPRLPADKAAFAAFHGARAYSRIDRDNEAIANYRKLVATYPHSSWAAEAQFRAGWLEVNRGRFKDALPDLRETLARYPKSAFADDAAWYLALAQFLLGDTTRALGALASYEQIARRNSEDAPLRACYWRARMNTQIGQIDEAKRLLRECVARAPFHYYGLLARARLRELGETVPWPAALPAGTAPATLRDPALVRVTELADAGLTVEAGIELERAEPGLIKRQGKARAMPFLLASYARLFAFQHLHKLAEGTGEDGVGDARLYWESAYPRAYDHAVEDFGRESGNPELFVYAIMRKESGYYPFAVSSSDARGLLQLIPTTAELVSKKLNKPFFPDELFIPERNIELGTAYLGGLLHRFRGQEALAAGAYNAGARAMMRWCDQWGQHPFDEFVELITYDQAREYIKRVLGIYARYRYIYGQPLELPLGVEGQYLKDGPDF